MSNHSAALEMIASTLIESDLFSHLLGLELGPAAHRSAINRLARNATAIDLTDHLI